MIRGGLIPVLLIILVSGAAILTAYSVLTAPGSVTTGLPSKFTVNGRDFAITSTASTQAERERGLMNTKVTNTTVMLFAWPNAGYYQFWMFDTNTSLDMIWVNETAGTGTVVYVVDGAPSCYNAASCVIYAPPLPANYVLEAKAGFAQENGIVTGSTLKFS